MIVDLTMRIREDMPGHPFHGRTPVFLSGTLAHDRLYPQTARRNPYDGSPLSFENRGVYICDHTGTHIDAPLHGDPEGLAIADLPLEYGYGDAVWLDLSSRFGDAAEISAEDLQAAESQGGEQIRPGDILLVWTGWSTVLPDVELYLYKHMGLTQDAANWIRSREVKTLGIDTPTPETVAGAGSSPVHMNFLKPQSLGRDDPVIAIIENLIHIDRIPQKRFTFCGVPLPFEGGTGSPVRALALV